MRIVAGTHRGRPLTAPRGTDTRPTSDRVREALFQILGEISRLRVLDLFAGSGALGIEALSRGATSATFVDSDRRSVAAITKNLADLDLDASVHKRDALTYLESADQASYDLAFVDPPYHQAARLAAPLSERLPRVLTPHARIVTESDKRSPLLLELPLEDERTYGDTRIAIHRAER